MHIQSTRHHLVQRYNKQGPTKNELPQVQFEKRREELMAQTPLASGALSGMALGTNGYRFMDQLDRFDGTSLPELQAQITAENKDLSSSAKTDRVVGSGLWLAGAAALGNAFAGALPGSPVAWGVAGAVGILAGSHVFGKGDESARTMERNGMLLQDLGNLAV